MATALDTLLVKVQASPSGSKAKSGASGSTVKSTALDSMLGQVKSGQYQVKQPSPYLNQPATTPVATPQQTGNRITDFVSSVKNVAQKYIPQLNSSNKPIAPESSSSFDSFSQGKKVDLSLFDFDDNEPSPSAQLSSQAKKDVQQKLEKFQESPTGKALSGIGNVIDAFGLALKKESVRVKKDIQKLAENGLVQPAYAPADRETPVASLTEPEINKLVGEWDSNTSLGAKLNRGLGDAIAFIPTKYVQGLTGGMVKLAPEAKTIQQKVFSSIAEIAGSVRSLRIIGAGLDKLAGGSTTIGQFIDKYPKAGKPIVEFAKNVLGFDIYGQLDPDTKNRLQKLSLDTATGAIFSALGNVKQGVIAVPVNWAAIYGLSKWGGASNEDAFIMATTVALLDATQRGTKFAFETQLKGRAGSVRLTPEEAVAQVKNTNLNGTEAGKVIENAALQAKVQNKDLQIEVVAGKVSSRAQDFVGAKTPKGLSFKIDLVEPKPASARITGKTEAPAPTAPESGTTPMSLGIKPTAESSGFAAAIESGVPRSPLSQQPTPDEIRLVNKKFNRETATKTSAESVAGKRENQRLNTEANIRKTGTSLGVENPQPETVVTMYRGGTEPIKPGDFVTTDLALAEKYVNERPGSKIYSKDVQVKDALLSGGLNREFIYAPESGVGIKEAPAANSPQSVKSEERTADVTTDGENEKYLKEYFEKDYKTATSTQIRTALEKTQKPISITDLPDVVSKVGSSAKAIDLPELKTRSALVYGGEKEGVFTDGFILVLDKSVASKINANLKKKLLTQFEKNYLKQDYTAAGARKEALADYEANVKAAGEYPPYKRVIPETLGKKAYVQGVNKNGIVIVTDGKQQTGVNADKLAFLQKQFPKAELFMQPDGMRKPLSVVENGEIKAVVMPITVQENVTDIPFKPDFAVKTSAPKASKSAQKSSSNIKANRAPFSEEPAREGTANTVKIIEFPEMVKMARDLIGEVPNVKKLRPGLKGYFNPLYQKIVLSRDLFKSEAQAARTLAHEIGHLVDFLGATGNTTKRGNLLGRLASLKSYRKFFISDRPPAEANLITPDDRKRLMQEARDLAKEPLEVTKEVQVGSTPVEPKEILAIWNETKAGEKNPDLLKYIQTLSQQEKVAIVKAALKGILPEWVKFENKITKTITVKEFRRAPADIRKHYKKLLEEEIIKRRLVSLETIKKELKNLSFSWRPFDPKTADAKQSAYRNSGEELYADAVSVLFNDPVRLSQEAPVFYRSFFNYLESKPQAAEAFFDAWHILNQGEEAVYKSRDKTMSESYKAAEDKFRAIHLDNQSRKSNLVEDIRILFDNKNQATINKTKQAIKKGAIVPDADNPIYSMASMNYIDGKLQEYIKDNFQPIYESVANIPDGWNTLGKVLQLERTIYERGELANPGGFTKKTAKDQLAALEKFTDPKEWERVQSALKMFRKAVQSSVSLAEENGFYTPDMIEKMKANPAYATYQVIDYLNTYVSAAINQQVGTLKDIANPATSTVMKTISLVKAIERNNTKKTVVKLLKENFPEEIAKSETRFGGRKMEIVETRDKSKGTVTVIENGKRVGYDIDKKIAKDLSFMSNETIRSAAKIMRMVSLSPVYRPLFTAYNFGFQTFNVIRDFQRYWKNVPDYTLGQALTSFPRAIARYGQAVGPAARRVMGKDDPIIKEMQEAKILNVSRDYLYGEPIEEGEQEIARVLKKVGILDQEKKQTVLSPVTKVLDSVQTLGNFVESLPKIAAYIELKGKMPEARLASFIRTKVGSPDFLSSGELTPITNSVFLFSNAIKEGIKSDLQVATGKSESGRYSQAGFWWKTAASVFLPKLIMLAMALGLFGKELKKQMENVSDYDKTNYHIIPMGLDENGKTKYLRVPQDETSRSLGAIFWKTLGLGIKGSIKPEDVFDILDVGADQIPNVSPAFTSMGVMLQYLAGQNPYDSFRGRNILTDREFDAGFNYSFPRLLDWLSQTNGLGIVLPKYQPENPTNFEKALNLPVLSNILGRWLKVSDYGQTELNKKVGAEVKREKAQEKIQDTKKIDAALVKVKSGTNKIEVERQLVNDIRGGQKMTPELDSRIKSAQNQYRLAIVKGQNDPNINSLIYATSNREKAAILKRISDSMENNEFDAFKKEAIRSEVISPEVIVLYQKL